MPKINADSVVSDAALSETPEPIEPDDLTPKKDEKPGMKPVMLEDDAGTAAKPAPRGRAKK